MSVKGVSIQKSRSALTILGIVIGIASVILIMSLGSSAQSLIVSQVESLGPANIFILPGREPTSVQDFAGSLLSDSLRERDVAELKKKENVPHMVRIVPFVFGPAVMSYESEVRSETVIGGTSELASTFNLTVGTGDFYTDDDVLQKNQVVVLGSKIATDLFGTQDIIGHRVHIKDRSFRVIGVMDSKGQGSFADFDQSVLMPYSTAQQYLLGIRYFHRIIIEIDSANYINDSIADIQDTLRTTHNIKDPSKDDFNVKTQADLVKTVGSITTVLTTLLSAVAAISLLVGGIGIMNIMLVSVTERTREIGLRKALGATNRDVLLQFLLEAVILTLAGGVIGIIIGAGGSLLASIAFKSLVSSSWNFSLPFSAILLGCGVSVIIGIIFGIYPARSAAKKSPMEALRYE
ncbi:MAG: Efflux ABC transporter, permease protein [Parcubacteria group bacterium Licking1014_17]|nr:MAG: Efflux ABC transporter, permease protein [Parcubacteria group bacterium Licking1014_17]